MNALYGLAIATSVLHSILFDFSFWSLYFKIFVGYTIVSFVFMKFARTSSKKHVMQSSWAESSNPTGCVVEDHNVTKALVYLKELNEEQKEAKVTMTHLMGYGIA